MNLFGIAIVVSIALTLSVDGATGSHPTLPELVTSSPKFSVLVELLQYTRLLDTVVNATNITIFAPTNFAFQQAASAVGCPTRTTQNIVDCIKIKFGVLYTRSIIMYHVVPGVLTSKTVLGRSSFATLNGQRFGRKGLKLVDNAPGILNPSLVTNVLNLKYDKGIVHGINGVLLPVPNDRQPTLARVAVKAQIFNVLLSLLEATKLTTTVVSTPYLTIFAPTDYAFRQTAKEVGCGNASTVDAVSMCLVDTLSVRGAADILAYHLVPGVITFNRVLKLSEIKTSAGATFFRRGLTLVDQAPALSNPKFIRSLRNVKYNYGIVHGINRVLIPFNTKLGTACDQLEVPLSLADGSFMPIFKLVNAVRKCDFVRKAIDNCKLIDREVCKSHFASKRVIRKITVGRVAAAAKKCKRVAVVAKSC